jgi:hypothetical protein
MLELRASAGVVTELLSWSPRLVVATRRIRRCLFFADGDLFAYTVGLPTHAFGDLLDLAA